MIPELLPAVTDPPSGRKAGRSLASASRLVSARGCSSRSMIERVALPLRDRDRHDLVGEAAGLDGRDGALLALERERVLVLARDAPALGDVLRGLAHRVRVVALGQARVDEAPAEGRVGHLARAAIPGALGLELDVRGAGHRFDAAADEHVAVADRDGVGGRVDRLEAGPAQPVDGQAADLDREVRQEQRHPRDVAVVLAGLVGTAEDDVLDERRIEPGPVHHGAQHGRGKVVRPNATPGRRRSGRSGSGRPRRSRLRAGVGSGLASPLDRIPAVGPSGSASVGDRRRSMAAGR